MRRRKRRKRSKRMKETKGSWSWSEVVQIAGLLRKGTSGGPGVCTNGRKKRTRRGRDDLRQMIAYVPEPSTKVQRCRSCTMYTGSFI